MATGANIQLGGVIKLGTTSTFSAMTDFSTSISRLVLHLGVNKVARRPTYGDPRVYNLPGARVDTIDVVGEMDVNDVEGYWMALLTAFMTTDRIVYFAAKYATGATSATNHLWTGSFFVDGLDVGTEVNAVKEITRTFDVRDVQGPLVTDPT